MSQIRDMNQVKVGQHYIGPGNDIFTIAEIGLNHNQNLNMALELIEVAADAGCSAAKFQTFSAKDVYVNDPRTGNYSLMGQSLPIYSLHESLEMPLEWIPLLKERCNSLGIEFFSAPIGIASLRALVTNEVNVLKVSSYECTNLPFLNEVASNKIPTIISTGACALREVEAAVTIFQKAECPVILLHCLTKYPAELSSANLSVMNTLRTAFNVPVGFSDNGFVTADSKIDFIEIPVEAAKTGADAFEIHITLDRSLPGPDHGFATEPHELKVLVNRMKRIREEIIRGGQFELDPILQGVSQKRTLPEEEYVRNFAFKCLFAREDIFEGEKIRADQVAILRPGEGSRGLEPEYYSLVTNFAHARHFIRKNDPITWESIL